MHNLPHVAAHDMGDISPFRASANALIPMPEHCQRVGLAGKLFEVFINL